MKNICHFFTFVNILFIPHYFSAIPLKYECIIFHHSQICKRISRPSSQLHGTQRWYSVSEGSCFSKDHLLTLTPEDIVCYFNIKVFGTMQPDEDTLPKFGRSTSLCFYKKSLSYFMPNKLLGWNVDTMSGNPTKSVLVDEVINKVKKMEVRKQGEHLQLRSSNF